MYTIGDTTHDKTHNIYTFIASIQANDGKARNIIVLVRVT